MRHAGMTRTAALLLAMFATALPVCRVSSAGGYSVPEGADPRRAHEEHLAYLKESVDRQMDELATLIPPNEVLSRRKLYYEWKLGLEIKCAEEGRNSQDPDSELICIGVATNAYFDALELELATLQESRAKSHP
jgi:hypothetical protein